MDSLVVYSYGADAWLAAVGYVERAPPAATLWTLERKVEERHKDR